MNREKRCPIKEWPIKDRPREKLFLEGERSLSTTELLAILLRTGSKGMSALDIARRVISKYKTVRRMGMVSLAEWQVMQGIGQAKIALIKAAIELGRRLREETAVEEHYRITSSRDIGYFAVPRLRDLTKEIVLIVFLNAQHAIIHIQEMAAGTVNRSHPIVREIFHAALERSAAALVCIHNHPSGTVEPSNEDRCFTEELIRAGATLDIKVLDHVIVAGDRYFSFADTGLL